MGKRTSKVSRHHARYVANIDFVEEVIKPRIASWREGLNEELDAMDEVDDIMREATLTAFDRVMDEAKTEVSHTFMTTKAIEKKFSKALSAFEKKVKPRILDLCFAIHESKHSAKHGNALEDGFKLTDDWRWDVFRMLLRDERVNKDRKSSINSTIDLFAAIFGGSAMAAGLFAFMGVIIGNSDAAGAFSVGMLVMLLMTFSSTWASLFIMLRFDYGKHVAKFIDDVNEGYRKKLREIENAEREAALAEIRKRRSDEYSRTKRNLDDIRDSMDHISSSVDELIHHEN